MRRIRIAVALVALALPIFASARTAADLQLAIRKLNVVGSALYIAAHPDDENTALLAWFGNERLVRAAYLSVTRGEGGQNLIGNEKGELLGVIRTQELLAARRIDRAEQFFTRAPDFGYSKTPGETLTIWNHDAVLADVVRVIRTLQPDVIVTRFPTTGEGGHGHHTASAILAQEAFTAAGDPTKFPEQLQTLAPWTPKRIFWNRFSWQRIDPNAPEVANDIRVDIGAYNPLLGRAYTEVAAESRSQHKSQGFGSAERRGSLINYFKQTGGAPAQKDLFEGVDLTWSRYPGGERLSQILARADATFDPADPQKSIPVLFEAYDELQRLGASDEWAPKRNSWIATKQDELKEVIRAAAGIAIDVAASQSFIVPGGEIPVSVTVVNRSDYPFTLSVVVSPYANPGKAPGTALKNNQPVKTDISIKLPDDYPYAQANEDAAALSLSVTLQDPQLRTLVFRPELIYRWTDPVAGEKTRPVQVVPEVAANAAEGVYLFPDAKPREISVQLKSFAAAQSATVRLALPAGWKAVPASAPVKLDAIGDETRVAFTVTPPTATESVQAAIEVELANGKKIFSSLTEIDYAHIPAQRIVRPSTTRLVRADVKKLGQRIGYIMGSGDDVPAALRQIGYQVELLSDDDLDRGDFSRYSAVVLGVRAYNTRKRLKLAHAKLMQYVENGGTVVTQYNTSGDDLAAAVPGPYPFKISRDRVTVENAPVRLVDPKHPLLTTPNKITPQDFDNWVQERGLYFTSEYDKKYATTLASNDPDEPEREGGQIYVRHGKGVFIYTSYSWFRQLPAGVPGAYRLFANLVSAR
ncbi:MAG: PIG-L family deacetylase [Thermoanaerobaculia bacterium]|nr:PIG-L family deacetylase [Thermoanaerobaculia bacterium]